MATTLDDIAHRAGITRGAIAWHFGSKAELLNAVIRERYARASTRMLTLAAFLFLLIYVPTDPLALYGFG